MSDVTGIDDDDDDDDGSEDGWVDVKHSDNELDDDEAEDDEGEEDEDEEDEDDSGEEEEAETDKKDIKPIEILDDKAAVQELALTRIFTDEDFKRIDAANIKKQTTNARKRPLESEKSEYVRLDDIEMVYKKRKHDKQSRLDSVMKGRTDREKFGYKDGRQNIHCSKTNKEKSKKKNFNMMRLKARSKVKASFKDKQQAMRKHLLKQKRMK